MKKQHTFLFCLLFALFSSVPMSAQISGNWSLVGPISFPVNDVGQINGIGRIEQLKFDPLNNKKMYATSATGGLFVTTDAGKTWSSTGTDSLGFGVASVCIDDSSDNILYVGSGDANYYSASYGVWKSTDAGATWKQATSGMGNLLAVELLMNPANHNMLIAATNSGIWKTTNGGTSWVQKHKGGKFRDMKFKADAGTQTIYAVTDSDYWYSTDMGETWKTVSLPVNQASRSRGGRIGLTIADSTIVYLTYVGDDAANCSPVLKSTNSGLSFSVVKNGNDSSLNGYSAIPNGSYSQGNYNYCMTVDPTNPNIIYVAAEMVWKSTNGGKNWSYNYNWPYGIHPDMHELIFDPNNNSNLYCVNDGGVWLTTNGSKNWQPMSNGISASECYHASCSPFGRTAMFAGLQDNGAVYNNSSNVWHTFQAGDVTHPWAADFYDSTLMYDLSDNSRRLFSGTSKSLNLPFSGGKYDNISFSSIDKKLAFISDSDIYISHNAITSYPSTTPAWTKISSLNTTISAIATSPADSNILFAVTSAGKFYYTTNALAKTPTWTSYNTPASVKNGAVIIPVSNNKKCVYLSCGSSMYRSTNYGSTWTNITSNLPGTHILDGCTDTYVTTEAIYVATATAVYYKDSTMSTWVNYSKGLPNTCHITNMVLFNDGTSNSRLRVSFYGRGMWESPLYHQPAPLGTVPVFTNENNFIVYPNPATGLFNFAPGYNYNKPLLVKVYNLLGECVYTKNLSQGNIPFTVDISSQSKGVYLYRISSTEGACLGSGKLMKE